MHKFSLRSFSSENKRLAQNSQAASPHFANIYHLLDTIYHFLVSSLPAQKNADAAMLCRKVRVFSVYMTDWVQGLQIRIEFSQRVYTTNMWCQSQRPDIHKEHTRINIGSGVSMPDYNSQECGASRFGASCHVLPALLVMGDR